MSASRAGRNAEPVFLGLLDRDQAIDDLAALDQKRVHRFIDTVDLRPQVGERFRLLARSFIVMARSGNRAHLIGGGSAEGKENIDTRTGAAYLRPFDRRAR